MKFLVLALLALVAVTASHGIPQFPKEAEQHDDETGEHWKGRIGWILEQLGKFLQQSSGSASYSAQDSAPTPDGAAIEGLRTVAQLLNKVADAAEKGEKIELFD